MPISPNRPSGTVKSLAPKPRNPPAATLRAVTLPSCVASMLFTEPTLCPSDENTDMPGWGTGMAGAGALIKGSAAAVKDMASRDAAASVRARSKGRIIIGHHVLAA